MGPPRTSPRAAPQIRRSTTGAGLDETISLISSHGGQPPVFTRGLSGAGCAAGYSDRTAPPSLLVSPAGGRSLLFPAYNAHRQQPRRNGFALKASSRYHRGRDLDGGRHTLLLSPASRRTARHLGEALLGRGDDQTGLRRRQNGGGQPSGRRVRQRPGCFSSNTGIRQSTPVCPWHRRRTVPTAARPTKPRRRQCAGDSTVDISSPDGEPRELDVQMAGRAMAFHQVLCRLAHRLASVDAAGPVARCASRQPADSPPPRAACRPSPAARASRCSCYR